jgi:MFS family permease
MINGSFWVGAALGALVAVALLNPSLFDPELGWRLAFLSGALIGLVVLTMRMWIPESPRWLAIHGRETEGETVVAAIEKRFTNAGALLTPVPETAAIRLRSRTHTPLSQVFDTLFNRYRLRTFVGLSLMAAQAFFYNAIFFTYALVLTHFYGVSASDVGWYILPFAAGNFLGPVVLGRLFDTLGRRMMISITYALSGLLLVVVGALFERDLLTAATPLSSCSPPRSSPLAMPSPPSESRSRRSQRRYRLQAKGRLERAFPRTQADRMACRRASRPEAPRSQHKLRFRRPRDRSRKDWQRAAPRR